MAISLSTPPNNHAARVKRPRPSRAKALEARLRISQPIPYAALRKAIEPHLRVGLSSRALGSDGRSGTWAPATLEPAWSDLRAGLALAAAARLPADEFSRPRGQMALNWGRFASDIRPLLAEAAGAVASTRATPASRSNTRSRVERLITALVVGYSGRAPITTRLGLLSPDWAAVVKAIKTHTPPVQPSIINGVQHLARAAGSAGLQPSSLPQDGTTLATLLVTLLPKRGERDSARSAIGRLAKIAVAGVPAWPAPSRLNATSRLSSDLEAHLRIASSTVPTLATWAREWRERRAAGAFKCGKTTLAGIEAAMLRLVGYAHRAAQAGIVPPQLLQSGSILAWWTTHLPIHLSGMDEITTEIGRTTSVYGAFRADARPLGTPAMVGLLVWAAREGLMPKGKTTETVALPRSIMTDAESLWRACALDVATRGGPAAMEEATRTAYEQAERSYRETRAPLKVLLGGELTVKDKEAAASMMGLPWVLAYLLPWWTEIELPRREQACVQFAKRLAELGASDAEIARHPEYVRARNLYRHGLASWLAFAAFVADPLRGANMHAARAGLVGTEIEVQTTFNEDGSLRRVQRVSSHFGGADWALKRGNPAAALKNRSYPHRLWDWPQVAVSMHWMKRYLSDVWHPTLVQRGLIDPATTVRQALASGRFALWVTDGGTQAGRETRAPVPGGYASAHSLRVLFRHGFLSALRAMAPEDEGLISAPLPDTDDEAAEVHPWLLSPHITRLWWATHCLAVLEDAGLAFERNDADGLRIRASAAAVVCKATTDSLTTLKKTYRVSIAVGHQQALRDVTCWRHPRYVEETVTSLLVAPDRRPDFAALFDTWAAAQQRDGRDAMPAGILRAWRSRNHQPRLAPIRRQHRSRH